MSSTTLLYILPGATRSDDQILLPAYLSVDHNDLQGKSPDDYLSHGHNVRVMAGAQTSARTYPYLVKCEYFPCATLAEVANRLGVRHSVLEPMAETDLLVRSRLTRYVALTDGSAHKMVQMNPDLVFVRQLPATIPSHVLELLRELADGDIPEVAVSAVPRERA